MYSNHSAYINDNSSEKVALAFIYPRKPLDTFSYIADNIWKLKVDTFVSNIYINNIPLDMADSEAVTQSKPYYYDIENGEIYYYTESDSPDDDSLVGEFKFFFSNVPLNLAHNLIDGAAEVYFEPRLSSKAGFKSKIGSDQMGISVTGEGSIELDNVDGFFDGLYNKYLWDNKPLEVYSYNRNLPPSEAKLTFKGIITNKSFNTDKLTFKVNDSIHKLDTNLPMNLFESSDGVSDSYIGDVKRVIYGKVEGLLCRSIDQVPESGIKLTGTVSGNAAANTITGSGTSFLQFVALNDTVSVSGNSYTVERVNSDTEIIISDTDGLLSTFSNEDIYITPSVPSPEFNRDFFIADHPIKQTSSPIATMTQLNRIVLEDASGFENGDIVKIDNDTFTIINISGNQIQINVNADNIYPQGALVTKEPITEYYIKGKAGSISDIVNIENTSEAKFTLSTLAEFRLSKNNLLPEETFDFINGSRIVTYNGTGDLPTLFRERDWIKAEGDIDARFLRIVDIVDNQIRCSEAYQGPTRSNVKVIKRRPDYISNESEVSVNCFGKTDDDTSTGKLIETGADIIKDLITSIGLSHAINTSDFDQASIDNDMRMSLKIPESISSSPPNVRDLINKINQTVFGSLALKQDFTLGYFINSPMLKENVRIIRDDDAIKWKFLGSNNSTYLSVLSNYRFTDYDLSLKSESSKTLRYTSERVKSYDLSTKEVERDFLSFNQDDTQELSERFIFFNEQIYSELEVESDLRLSDVEVGDIVDVRFSRINKLLDTTTNYFRVIGVTVNYNSTKLILSNFGDLYNKGGRITDDNAPSYSEASISERTFDGYITDGNGLITGESNTKNNNLIS